MTVRRALEHTRRLAIVVAVCAAVVCNDTSGAFIAQPRQVPQNPPVVIEQSAAPPFVSAGQPATLALRVSGAQPGDVIRRRIAHLSPGPMPVADQVRAIAAGQPLSKADIVDLTLNPATAATSALSVVIPATDLSAGAGVYGVSVELWRTGKQQALLRSWVVVTPENGAPLKVVLTDTPDFDISTHTDGSVRTSQATRDKVDALTAVLRVDTRHVVTPAVRGETLDALSRSANRADRASAAALKQQLRDRPALRATYSRMHLGAWVAQTENPDLALSFARSTSIFRELIGHSPTGDVAAADPSLTAQAVRFLRDGGARVILVDPAAAPVPASERPTRRSFQLGADSGPTVTGLWIDEGFSAALPTTDDAALSRDFVATVAAEALDGRASSGDKSEVMVLRVPQAASPTALGQILDALAGAGPLVQAVSAPSLATNTATIATGGTPVEVTIPNTPRGVLGSVPRLTLRARQALNAYRSTVDNSDATAQRLDDRLLLCDTLGFTSAQVGDYLRPVTTRTAQLLDSFTMAQPGAVTITSAEAVIPIRMTNTSPYPARAAVSVISDRVGLADARRTMAVRLPPGDSTVRVRLRVRSSGQFRVRIRLLAYDQATTLDEKEVVIRSTAFAGLGLLLSAAALVVLMWWWIRTILRARHTKEPDSSAVA